MAEGLALTASIIAVIQASARVISFCCQFVGKVRGAERDVAQMITTITALKGFLEFLEKVIKDDETGPHLPRLGMLSHPDGPLAICTALLKDIEDKLRPKRGYNGLLQPITWPWKRKDYQEWDYGLLRRLIMNLSDFVN
jgi:hypothetical protein